LHKVKRAPKSPGFTRNTHHNLLHGIIFIHLVWAERQKGINHWRHERYWENSHSCVVLAATFHYLFFANPTSELLQDVRSFFSSETSIPQRLTQLRPKSILLATISMPISAIWQSNLSFNPYLPNLRAMNMKSISSSTAHSAGLQHRCPAEDFPDKAWDEVIGVNLTAGFQLSKELAKHWLNTTLKNVGHLWLQGRKFSSLRA
jgi:hypothetical protein